VRAASLHRFTRDKVASSSVSTENRKTASPRVSAPLRTGPVHQRRLPEQQTPTRPAPSGRRSRVRLRSGGSAAAGRPPRSALRVRVAPVTVQDVVYQIKSLGQIEARTWSRSRPRWRASRPTCASARRPGGAGHGAPADRPRSLPAGGGARTSRPRAVPGRAVPGRRRPEAPRGPGPERPPLGRGAEPLALRQHPPHRLVEVAQPPWGSPSRTWPAPRCARRSLV